MSTKNKYYCTLLPMGNAGVGKSTFLNLIRGLKILKTSGLGKSCTKEITKIEFLLDDLIMTLIDAPGLGDTDGDEQKNNINLINFLKKHEHGLNGIAIVISAADHRIGQNLQNTIKFLYRFFDDGNFWYHVCIIVTHCPYYQEDIDELKESMTNSEGSLQSEMINMIQNVCNLDKYPEIPFFFFDSKHPDNSPTKESLPEFMQWLKRRCPFSTQNLEVKDFKWQYQEKREENKIVTEPMKPIFEFIPGEPEMITVEEDVPYTVKEKRIRQIKRCIDKWVNRKWDGWDYATIGIARWFRDNKEKVTEDIIVDVEYEENVIHYRKEQKTIFSGKYGENQKKLIGYYKKITSITESYTACWPYDCDIEDIKNRTNPIKIGPEITEETIIDFYDSNKAQLNPNDKINEIKKLESIINCQ